MSKILVLLVIVLLLVGGCTLYYVYSTYYRGVPEVKAIYELVNIYDLNYNLEKYVGKKVTVAGYFGHGKYFGGGNASFLIVDYNRLIIDEPLPFGSWIRLDGMLPFENYDESLIQVCGVVKRYADKYNVFSIYDIPLIEVEEYRIVEEVKKSRVLLEDSTSSGHYYILTNPVSIDPTLQEKVKNCDRALIISGGVDEHNNHPRYRNNIVEKYKKLKSFGFKDDMITVLYYDGSEIRVNGKNIVDGSATRSNINSTIRRYLREMDPCCTLYIFVTDHGFGYNPKQGDGWGSYKVTKVTGTPNPLDPSRGDPGKSYREDELVIDARDLKYKYREYNFLTGKWCIIYVEKTGKIYAWKWNSTSGKWELMGSGKDNDNNGKISEQELGVNIDNDPRSNYEIELSSLASTGYSRRRGDLNGDGQVDFEVIWDGRKFVARIRDSSGSWRIVGEDTDNDNIIKGVDLDLDGSKDSTYTFHEAICLYGREMLWDYELAKMLKPLHDKGIHILVEMGQCFGGGFIKNLEGIVDKIVTAADEDRKAYATKDKWSDFEHFFIKNLEKLSVEGWNTAFNKVLPELIRYQVKTHGEWLDSPRIGEAPKKPDLVVEISLFYYTNKPCVGEIPIIVVIRNVGWESVQNPKVNIYINDKVIEKTVNIELKPKDFETLELKYVFKKPGEYKLKAVVDPDNRVDEVFEDNNKAEAKYEVSAPDLTAESITLTPKEIQTCTDVKIKVNVTNKGYCVAYNFKVKLEVLGPKKALTVPICIVNETSEFLGLDVGGSFIVEFKYHFKEAGEYIVRAIVDSEDKVIELNEDNNVKEVQVKVSPIEELPELSVKIIVPEWELHNGTLYRFDVMVYNYGEVEASTTVLLEISDGRRYESGTMLIPAGGYVNATFFLEFPIPDAYTLRAIVDPYDTVQELNEENNEYTVQITVLRKPLPDLIVRYLKVYYTVYVGDEYQYIVIDKVDFTISNIGFGNYSEDILVHVWVDSPKNVIAEYVFPEGLESMESFNHTLQLNYQVTYGDHVVGVAVDPLNNVVEEKEDNNTLTVDVKPKETASYSLF